MDKEQVYRPLISCLEVAQGVIVVVGHYHRLSAHNSVEPWGHFAQLLQDLVDLVILVDLVAQEAQDLVDLVDLTVEVTPKETKALA